MSSKDQSPPPARDSLGLSLADVARQLAERKLPPVDTWNPSHCGPSDMRIAADGTWYHMGTPIGRHALVKLFSTILRREADGHYVLVTPAEKLDIEVEDAPFVAVEMLREGEGAAQTLSFRLNTDEYVVADAAHPLRIALDPENTPRPYVMVRGGMEALIARSVFYELAEMALQEKGPVAGVWSAGVFFPFTGSAG